MNLVGKIQIMTPEGPAEMPFYVDQKDVLGDWKGGVIKEDTRFVYRDRVYEPIEEFTDEDGETYMELLLVDGAGVQFVQFHQF